jgi:acyl carrier protein
MEKPSSLKIDLVSGEELERRVVEIISASLCIEAENVLPSSSYQDLLSRSYKDLGADSLDLYATMMDLEEELGVSIPDREAERFATVGDTVQFIAGCIARSASTTSGYR